MLKIVFAALTRNVISLAGAVIAVGSAVLIVCFFVLEVFGFEGGPYLGILTYLLFPAIMFAGLVMIPTGILYQRKRDRQAIEAGERRARLPVIDFNQPRTRSMVLLTVVISIGAGLILVGGTYKGVHFMDSTAFCGTVCHSVMQPEYTAHQRSPHAKVECAQCHIGPGAEWFVKSKLSGSWQMIAVAFDLYPRPVPSPVHNLRPARDTCEQCHWPTKFHGNRLHVRRVYEEDEDNTELTTALMLRVGGLQADGSSGIHWHVDPNNKIRYLSSPDRETIYDVELSQADGTVKLYKNGEVPPDATWREMDCVDCHNRPTHIYNPPDVEIDMAIADGRIDRELPYVKREALKALQVDYSSHEEAKAGISEQISAFYRDNYPDRVDAAAADIEQAGNALGEIYSWNVFPQMNVTWGTYPDHIGHADNGGCFRCHDKRHRTEDRERIGKDCELCHVLLAEEEAEPEIVQQLQP